MRDRRNDATIGRMRNRSRLALAIPIAALLLAAAAFSPGAAPTAALSRWTGSVDLYRAGTFTTQKSWLWCTAADVQIMRNIADRRADHSTAGQRTYFAYMRAHNRYRLPVSDGVDPVGWTAGLRRYVDDRYRLVTSRSFDAALRSAVTSLRRTNLPVGITVSRGGHAWILMGFSATADPAATTRFTVTSVRVVGPLWGLQSRTYGYDMRPNTSLTPRQLRGFFTPWHYAGVRMVWEGRWVSIQPVGRSSAPASAASRSPAPTVAPRPSPKATAALPSSAAPSRASASSGAAGAAIASAQPNSTPTAKTAASTPGPTTVAAGAAAPPARAPDSGTAALVAVTLVLGGLAAVIRLAQLRRTMPG